MGTKRHTRQIWADLPVGDGVRGVTVGDAWELCGWMFKGYIHAVKVTSGRQCAVAAAMLGCLILTAPLLWPVMAGMICMPGRYGWRTDTAALFIAKRRNHWLLDTHLSRNPGTGQGAVLRDAVVPQLKAAATHEGTPVRFVPADPRLLARYTRDAGTVTASTRNIIGQRASEWAPPGHG